MNYESGELICPKCKNNGMDIYTNWISREVYNGKIKKKQWIFYYKTYDCDCEYCFNCNCRENWIFLFFETQWNVSCSLLRDFFCCHECSCSCILFEFIMIFYFIFYISIFWIIDLIRFLFRYCSKCECDQCCNCCIRYEYYYNAGRGVQTIDLSICSTINEIWNSVNSDIANQEATENFWTDGNKKRKDLFRCSQCYYNPNSFIDFIKNSNDISVNISENIAVNIYTMDNQIHCPIPCNPNDLFKIVIDKFYELYPDYKNKECYFLSSGRKLEPNLSLSQNGVNNGVNILLKINDVANSEVTSISYNK